MYKFVFLILLINISCNTSSNLLKTENISFAFKFGKNDPHFLEGEFKNAILNSGLSYIDHDDLLNLMKERVSEVFAKYRNSGDVEEIKLKDKILKEINDDSKPLGYCLYTKFVFKSKENFDFENLDTLFINKKPVPTNLNNNKLSPKYIFVPKKDIANNYSSFFKLIVDSVKK